MKRHRRYVKSTEGTSPKREKVYSCSVLSREFLCLRYSSAGPLEHTHTHACTHACAPTHTNTHTRTLLIEVTNCMSKRMLSTDHSGSWASTSALSTHSLQSQATDQSRVFCCPSLPIPSFSSFSLTRRLHCSNSPQNLAGIYHGRKKKRNKPYMWNLTTNTVDNKLIGYMYRKLHFRCMN